MKMRRFAGFVIAVLAGPALCAWSGRGGDRQEESGSEADTVLGSGRVTLRILSGSENQELEPVLEDFSKESGIQIEMTYQGSLDIM